MHKTLQNKKAAQKRWPLLCSFVRTTDSTTKLAPYIVLERDEISSRIGGTFWSRQQSRLGNALSVAYSRHIYCSNSVMSIRVRGHAVN